MLVLFFYDKIIFMKANFLNFVFFILLFAIPIDVLGATKTDFYVEPGFSEGNETKITAELIYSPDKLHFYIEDDFWASKTEEEKEEIEIFLEDLGKEFNEIIYPQLTSAFGKEALRGPDKDERITVVFHSLREGVNGYIRNIDAYEKSMNPFSNERKLIYLDIDLILGSWVKETLAHEFVHLITLKKKDLDYGVIEDVWLNEARAEYAVTLLGYNIGGGYIEKRIKSFIEKPYISLINWNNSFYNYGIINSFVHYLVDQYGVEILIDSLMSSKKGVESINEALLKNGFDDKFSDIFINWAIAVYVNDCSLGEKYCFKDENFKNKVIIPFGNFLPFSGESTLYTGQTLKNFSAHWQRYVGGKGEIKVNFSNPSGVVLRLPYIIKSVTGKVDVHFMDVSKQEAELIVSNFGKEISSITFIPLAINENIDSSNDESYFYSIAMHTSSGEVQENENNISDNIELPFSVDKPLNQMNREELLMVIIRLIIHLLLQGKAII